LPHAGRYQSLIQVLGPTSTAPFIPLS
jgi:hypothetical protein